MNKKIGFDESLSGTLIEGIYTQTLDRKIFLISFLFSPSLEARLHSSIKIQSFIAVVYFQALYRIGRYRKESDSTIELTSDFDVELRFTAKWYESSSIALNFKALWNTNGRNHRILTFGKICVLIGAKD